MRQNRETLLVLGLLVLTILLVALIVTGLWRMQHNQDIHLWLMIAAITVSGALLFLAVLIAMPDSDKNATAIDWQSVENHLNRADSEPKVVSSKDTENLTEVFKTIQAINQNLEQAVGQVRGRLQGMVPPADDRRPGDSLITADKAELSPGQEKANIH